MSYPENEDNIDNMMLYILTLLCNIRSINALIIIQLEYALPDPDIILILHKLSQNKIKCL